MKIRELNEAISKALNEKIKPIKAIKPTAEQKEFLDKIAKMIENEEGISYGELSELQSLQPQIVYIGDIRLAEWSGIPEEVWNISCIDESIKPSKTEKKVLKEAVTNKKGLNEDVNTVYVLINNKVALNFEQDFDMAIDVLDAEGLKKRAEELDKNFEQNAKEANLGSPLMSDVLYAIKVLRDSHYFVLIRNVH